MQTIVVALSRSECTGDVLDEAMALAGHARARLVLLHVVEPLEAAPSAPAGDVPATELVASAERWLAAFVERANHGPHHVLARVEYGDVVESILDVTTEQGAAHLVVGSRQRRGLARLLLGSTAQAVSKRAPCPVHLVRHLRKASCKASSCQWCEDGVDPVRERLEAEAEG
jgi:nucleotide-binding universal stress UspA family protein